MKTTRAKAVTSECGSKKEQVSPGHRDELEKQAYRIVGSHSAVKVCGWTKNMLKGKGGCYKLKFYGIQSHQCMQMSTNLSCANRCEFCWRGSKAPVEKEWVWGVDDPDFIIENSLEAHHKLLTGFGGRDETPKALFEKSKHVGHVALSLTGEPITYPKINEICKKFHERKISTFIVSNAQYPDAIKNLNTITQLYLSLDAPNKQILKELDKPLYPDYWQRYVDSIKEVAKKNYRTAARLTVVKGVNDVEPENYAKFLEMGDFDFVEIKAFMYVGEARNRLKRATAPEHEYVKEFGMKILEHLPDYEFVSEHLPSKVILLAKKKYNKSTWIDFEKFFELVNVKRSPKNLEAMKYATGVGKIIESKDDFGVVQ
jgi:tRNA wybutosine-synthesizing protein 1